MGGCDMDDFISMKLLYPMKEWHQDGVKARFKMIDDKGNIDHYTEWKDYHCCIINSETNKCIRCGKVKND